MLLKLRKKSCRPVHMIRVRNQMTMYPNTMRIAEECATDVVLSHQLRQDMLLPFFCCPYLYPAVRVLSNIFHCSQIGDPSSLKARHDKATPSTNTKFILIDSRDVTLPRKNSEQSRSWEIPESQNRN